MKDKTNLKINANVSRPEKKDIIAALNDIKKKLGLKLNLKPKERKMIASMAESRTNFVNDVIRIIKLNPKIINGSYNIDQLIEKYKTTLYYLELSCEAEKLAKQLYDYSQIKGSETFKEALLVKKHIKTTCELNPEYVEFIEKLNKYFPVTGKNKTQNSVKLKHAKASPCLDLKKHRLKKVVSQ